ncbi:MAG: repeat containing protein, partial [Chthoniobacteraceae bacterium]|nr:repeat containing protein [Chthoniobacteraceae bacterium]
MHIARILAIPLLAAASLGTAAAQGTSQTPLKTEDFDRAAFSEWNGADTLFSKVEPQHAIWTRSTRPDFRGVTFGDSANPGTRHLRVGLNSPVAIGSVLVRGGGQLSVLKPDAVYPGDPARESDWLPAERVQKEAVTQEEVAREEFAVWTLPPDTITRALRFTHTAQPADPKYSGWLGGALILSERVVNIAPQAIASANAQDEAASKIINSKDEQWSPWDNGKEGASQPVSAERPESIMLVWPKAVLLSGLEAIWAGFSAADVQVYTGEKHPREAAESDWKTIKSFGKLENGYPLPLFPNALAWDQPVKARAIRLRLTAVTMEGHSHLKGNTKDGKRVWLGELMAFQALGNAELKTALPLVAKTEESHPPIPIRFKLAEAGFVTLVVEDSAGKRVRNLVAETRFPAGDNVAWWDGTDDLGRDNDAARHGLYHIPEQPVAPGTYRVRGLFHNGLDLRYEFSVYNAGNPAWETEDKSGGWLTNHTPPQSVLFVPDAKKPMVYIGSAVSEGGAGLAWIGLDGKKVGGRGWIGGNWTAAPYLARDAGKNALPDIYAYVGATWTSSDKNEDKTHGELRITGLSAKGDKPILKYPFTPPAKEKSEGDADWIGQLGGIAVHDGLLAASFSKLGTVLFVDAKNGKVLGQTALENPRGLVFDSQGRLLVLSGNKLVRFNSVDPANLPPAQTLVSAGLQEPQGITLDAASRIYVSDRGTSHRVTVFSPEGAPLSTIGHAGGPKAGLYDPLQMSNPHGLAIDENQQLWVAENDFQPKRVSVWSLDGKLIRAAYGPGRYGGGGTLDPRDKNRFYYDGIEFKLDWQTGTSLPAAVFHRSDALSSQLRTGPPETPLYFENRQYMTNCFNSSPTNGTDIASIWLLKENVAVPAASFGRANEWPLLKEDAFKPRWPQGVDLNGDRGKNAALFAWSDLNGDAQVQPEEVTMIKAVQGGVTVMPDLAFVESRVDTKAMRFAPKRFTELGVPVYDLAAGEILVEGAQSPGSSGGDQGLVGADGWSILTVAPKPFAREGVAGIKNGEPIWSYPSPWPGLHA